MVAVAVVEKMEAQALEALAVVVREAHQVPVLLALYIRAVVVAVRAQARQRAVLAVAALWL